MSAAPPDTTPEKVPATPRHWLWTLASVAALVVILLSAVVYFFGYDGFKAWVDSPLGQRTASTGLGKAIKVDGQFAPLHLDGWTIVTDSFASQGWPGEAIGGLNATGVRAELDPAAIWRGVYRIKGIQIDRAQVTLLQPNDALKRPVPPKKPRPWYAHFLPSVIECGPIVSPDTALDFQFQNQMAHIRDAHVEADLVGRDFKYTATSGTLEFPYLPLLRIERLEMFVTRPLVTIMAARLVGIAPNDTAQLTLSGSIGMRENKSIEAIVQVKDMPIEQMLPPDLAALIHGRATGALAWKRDASGQDVFSEGELSLAGATIDDLSVFKQLALLHGNPDLQNFTFDALNVKFHLQNGIFTAKLAASSMGKFSLTGTVTYELKTRIAVLELAFTDLPLKIWLPSEFKPRYSGVGSATLQWRGQLNTIKDSSGAVSLNLDGARINNPVLLRKFLATKGLRAPDEIDFKTAQLDFTYQDQTFQLARAQLDAPGFLTVSASGKLTTPDDALDADMTWQGLILQKWLPSELAQQISGDLNGHAKFYVKQWQYQDGSYAGNVELVRGQLLYTSVQSMFARFVNDRRLLKIPLTRAVFSWNWDNGGFVFSGIDLRGGDDIGVQGRVAANQAGEISGVLWVGIRPAYLKSLMGLGNGVFTRDAAGLKWARVTISGTVKKPRQDLSSQLLAQLGRHPLALFGLSGKLVSWYVGNLFGAKEDWKRPDGQ
jgi:hypothetical protein